MINSFGEGGRHETREHITRVTSDFENADGTHPTLEIDQGAPGLFMFDIDGTLIDATKIHGPAAISLFRETFGDNSYNFRFGDPLFEAEFIKTYVSHFGLGDRQEFEMLSDTYGVVFESDKHKQSTLDSMVQAYGGKIEEAVASVSRDPRLVSEIILPNVREFLDEMRRRKIPAALITGNSSRSAHAFMKHLGLSQYFITGGFDDDPQVENEPYRRAHILRSALRKSREKGIEAAHAAIFGDTAKDFLATDPAYGAMGGVKPHVLLVATGDHTLHDLSRVRDSLDAAPHLILNSFSSIKIREFFDSLERYKKKAS